MVNNKINSSLERLKAYIEKEKYAGFDPYDALSAPLFQLPFFKSNKIIRFGIQQLVKRSPFNLRPLLKIPKGINPVTLGLCLQGYTSLLESGSYPESEISQKCNEIILQLQKLIPEGFKGACWGYDFPWEARNATIPAYQPTVVATGIITNALYKYFLLTGNALAIELCRSACDFVLHDLNQHTAEDGSICFSYSPFDNLKVYNASMKGCRLLIQVYNVTKDKQLLNTAEKAARYVIKNQQQDGSWFYADSQKGKWVDNYHTGYVLDCLDEYRIYSKDYRWNTNIDKGLSYYQQNLFEQGHIPKFYNNSLYPLDCTSAAQAILTLCRFEQLTTAIKSAEFTIDNMQHSSGFFYFRKYSYFTEKQSFMRWSNAWMFAALCTINMKTGKL